MENELLTDICYPHHDTVITGEWVIAFDDDGQRWMSSSPEDDFYAPVPDSYKTEEGAKAAIAVLKAWTAPVGNNEEVLAFDVLRATPEWTELEKHMGDSSIGDYEEHEFTEAEEYGMSGGLPGAYAHYRYMVDVCNSMTPSKG